MGFLPLLLLFPLAGLAQERTQTDVGLHLGLTTFRDNRYSAFRYEMPSVGVQLNRVRYIGRGERRFSVEADWGQQRQSGRFFQQTAGLSVRLQRTYELGTSSANDMPKKGRFGLGWQAQLALRTYYDQLIFDGPTLNQIGGYGALELAPVFQYRVEFGLANRPVTLTNYLTIPLLTGLIAGNSGGAYSAGVAFPGTYTGLTNQLWLTLNESARHPWRVGYQWNYRSIQLANADQQHATNGISICRVL